MKESKYRNVLIGAFALVCIIQTIEFIVWGNWASLIIAFSQFIIIIGLLGLEISSFCGGFWVRVAGRGLSVSKRVTFSQRNGYSKTLKLCGLYFSYLPMEIAA